MGIIQCRLPHLEITSVKLVHLHSVVSYNLLHHVLAAAQIVSMRKSGKMVIVSEYYAPDRSTTAIYMAAIAKGLSTDT